MAHDIVFYRSLPTIVEDRYGRKEYGDIPCIRYNEITGKFEPVVNPRGNAYAARNRIKYRRG